jgi:protein TonB
MSAAVNDRPHDALSSRSHLPLTGEFHPLRREFERLLATGNIVALTFAMLACTIVYFWPRESAPIIDDIVKIHRIVNPSPPPIPTERNGTSYDVPAPPVNRGSYVIGEPDSAMVYVEPRGGNGDDDPGDVLNPYQGSWQPGDPIAIPTPAEPQVHDWWDEAPVMLSCDPPVYPAIVRDAGIDGTVHIRVLIGVDGKVKDAHVVDGPAALRDAALASAHTAIFKPALQGIHPVEVWVVIPITFQLQGTY